MKLLFATDGEAAAINAASLITRLVRRDGVEITALAVGGPEHTVTSSGADESNRHRVRAEEAAAAAANDLREAGFVVDPAVASGDPAGTIVSTSLAGGHDVIVTGAHRTSFVGNLLLGSVSTRVLHATEKPVIVVHRGPANDGPVRVLVATDGSDEAAKAASTFAALADPAACDVTVLSVVPGGDSPDAPPLLAVRDAEEARMDSAATAIDAVADRLRTAGFATTAAISRGWPHMAIEREAEAGDHDLVVVGSRGLSPAEKLVKGSVSDLVAWRCRAALVARL